MHITTITKSGRFILSGDMYAYLEATPKDVIFCQLGLIQADDLRHHLGEMWLYDSKKDKAQPPTLPNGTAMWRDLVKWSWIYTVKDQLIRIKEGDSRDDLPLIRVCASEQYIGEEIRYALDKVLHEEDPELRMMLDGQYRMPSLVSLASDLHRLTHYLLDRRYPSHHSTKINPYETIPYLQMMLRIIGYHGRIIHMVNYQPPKGIGYKGAGERASNCILKIGDIAIDVALRHHFDECSPYPAIRPVTHLTQHWQTTSEISKQHCNMISGINWYDDI